ncbi:MAG: glycoside hydrolase family 78 protein [Oscillospiraceae bacterium]|nr:glycoside hydrolase family 78 protein [Oscillospiraceae bacterium]
MLTLNNLKCDNSINPVGIPLNPRFSWQIESNYNAVYQRCRQIQLATDEDFKNILWDDTKENAESIHVNCEAKLAQQQRYFWRVKIWDNYDNESNWSETATFVTALGYGGFKAPFVSGEGKNAGDSSQGTMLRGEFSIKPGIKTAILSATALGVYQLWLNEKRVSEDVLAPGWTEYESRLLYQSYDVTALLKEGENAAGAMIGPGWYKGDLGFKASRCNYGEQTAFAMQLMIQYKDGTTETISTGDNWRAHASPVIYSEIYHGETYDAGKEKPGWTAAGYDTSSWQSVEIVSVCPSIITPQDGPPIRRREVFKPKNIFTAPNGEIVVDFGQNMTGWVRLRVKGNAGDIVEYSHAEILDKDGNFYNANLRSAKSKASYTLKGESLNECDTIETYEPLHTFYGFRYIRIDKFPGEASADNFEAVAVYSDMKETGSFTCSHAGLNQLEHNVRWGMKGNFLDIPTDCPQRDERLGWTGDAQVFIRAAFYLHDGLNFFRKWLRDMAIAQEPSGAIPYVIPDILRANEKGSSSEKHPQMRSGATGWGDAATICPWTAYIYSGDESILSECYPMMTAWIEFIRSRSRMGLLWMDDWHFGDWVALDAKEGDYIGATPTDFIATAYYAYSTEILAKTAAVLGRDSDARKYNKLREDIGAAFVREFFTPNGRLAARTQTAHIIALHFGLVPHEFKKRTLDTLVDIIAEYKDAISTGFLGTPYICYALSDNGRMDLAYKLLLREEYPSWLYPLSKDATTIWEHWDGMKPDGSMWSDDMNSFNHYAYGAVADWMYSVIGGIDADENAPGYRHSRIAPRPGGGITFAKTTQITGYGELISDWKLDGSKFTLNVTIPNNTIATISLPKGDIIESAGLSFKFDGTGNSAEISSGKYKFVVENIE